MKLKKLDIVVIVVLILISIGSAGLVFIQAHSKYDKLYVEISVKGNLYKSVPLEKNSKKQTIEIISDLGKNIVEIENGKVKIVDADCPDKVCVKDGARSNPGEMLVCLPHKVVVQIKGQNNTNTDALSF